MDLKLPMSLMDMLLYCRVGETVHEVEMRYDGPGEACDSRETITPSIFVTANIQPSTRYMSAIRLLYSEHDLLSSTEILVLIKVSDLHVIADAYGGNAPRRRLQKSSRGTFHLFLYFPIL